MQIDLNKVPKFPLKQICWIKEASKTCSHRADLHEIARQRFHALDVSSLVTIIILSTTSSAISLFGDSCKDSYVKIMTGLFNLTITGLTSWYGFHKYSERKRSHERTRNAYLELYRKLNTELVLEESNEQHFRTLGSLINRTQQTIDRIESESPNFPKSFQKKDTEMECLSEEETDMKITSLVPEVVVVNDA